MEWTSEAKQTLHAYIAETTGEHATSETYQDLFTDLAAHVEEELHQKGIKNINAENLRVELSSLGADEFHQIDESFSSAAKDLAETNTHFAGKKSRQWDSSHKTGCFSSGVWLFNIIIPIAALLTELFTHESKSSFFDPIPTWMHVVFIALVPTTFILNNHLIKNAERYQDGDARSLKFPKIITLLLGFTLPTIIYYAFLFLPILPMSVVACILLIGLLPLAPIFCLVGWFPAKSALLNTLRFTKNYSAQKWLNYGMISGLICLIALETPSYLRQAAINNALSENTETQLSGIKNIRRFGGEDQLHYYCYYGNRRSRGSIGNVCHDTAHWAWNLFDTSECSAEQAREIYYRVTGVPFNSVKPPSSRGDFFDEDWAWESDNDHGGDAVASRTKGLTLHSSRMDMHLDDESKLGYVEWIIEFKNDNRLEKEARMQIALPHQGFVSKLTLWVNGEERPAAFSSVSKVKEAYQEIAVRQRQDPVLVNVSGADRAMLQCFPVPANGGVMRMKVGITFPIQYGQTSSGNIHFPYIAERNFSIPKSLEHAIYAQSDLQINAPNATKQSTQEINAIQLSLPYSSLKTERITWQDLTASNQAIWTNDDFYKGNETYLIRTPIGNSSSQNQAVIVVIDGSAALDRWKTMIEKVITQKRSNIQFYQASSGQNPLTPITSTKAFSELKFIGGIDNVPALRKALSIARKDKNKSTSILWLHGSQPVRFNTIAGLEQDIERSLTTVPIYTVALEDGENYILRAFKNCPDFQGGCRVVNDTDLTHMLDKIRRPQQQTNYTWKRSMTPPLEGVKVWDQLARKWAYDETVSLWRKKESSEENRAAELAAHYQLVTPVSGAVVLETEAQYKQTGLEVPSSINSPSIPASPEPSTALLMFIGAFYTVTRRKRSD